MSNNILYLGTLNGVQLDFVTGNLTEISGFTGDVRNAVITQSVTNGVTDQAPSADAIHDFVTGVSGYLSENSNDTLYDLTVQAGGANSSVIRLEPEAGTNETETVSDITLSGGQDILIDENTGLGLITITHSNTALGATSSFNLNDSVINGVGIDDRGHVTGFTTTGLDGRYYTEEEINNKLTNTGNWNTAYDRSITGVDFNTGNGDLTLQKEVGTIVKNLDGRYLLTETQSLEDVVAFGNTSTSGIEVKNVYIAVDGNSEISTDAGDLTLDSAGGTVIVDDNLIVNSNTTILGNLLVSGTTTTIESSVTTISDPILTLGSGTIAADDGKDRGVEFIYYDTEIRTGFFGYDNQKSRFAFFTGATNTNENFSGVAAPLDLSATVDNLTIEYIDVSGFLQVKDGGITNAKLDNSSLTVLGGSGLSDIGNPISLGGTGTLNIGQGNGITVGADSISVNPYNGITVDGNGVSVTAYNGITVDASGVSVTGYQGISVDSNGVSTISDQTHLDKIEIGADNTTTSITSSYGGIIIGRAFSASGAAISLTTSGNTDSEGTDDSLIVLASDSTLTAEGTITARGTSSSDSASWKFVATITNNSGTTETKLAQVTKIYSDSGASSWTVAIGAATNGFEVQGNSNSSTNVAWSCTVNYNVITA